MNLKRTFYPIICAVLVLGACDNSLPSNIELQQKSKTLVLASNSFGFNLFETILINAEQDKNLMISPLSVNQALSMALNGATDNTLMEMTSTLDFFNLTISEINQSNQEVYNALVDHDSKVDLKIANSIWYKSNIVPNETFIADNELFYKAELASFDLDNAQKAVDSMNKWVDNNTKGKIKKIVNEIKDEDVMFLINAVYFKAEWKTKFKKTDTRLADFTPEGVSTKQVETMIGEAELTYKNENRYSVIKLPYGSGKFNMVIYLPEEGFTTSDIISELANTDFETLNTATPAKMDIWLPKFEFEYENELNDELDTMGIHDAFNPLTANFSNVCDKDVYISSVMHKTYIKTDEEGSEAAAATKVTFGVTSVGPGEVIRINRSFLFAIVEQDTNTILFIGKVHDPSI